MQHRTIRIIVLLTGLLAIGQVTGCGPRRLTGPMHQRLGWKAEEFFTHSGVIALCRAIEAKDLEEIDRLVKSGVNVNAKGRGNVTPLLWAFPMGEDVFGKLLELGADPNVRLTENHLLLKDRSVTFASVRLVEGLIYNTYFHDVPMDNYLRIVLEHGGDPNQEDINGETPLFHIQSRQRAAEQVRLLLDAGADINHKDGQGKTPLMSPTASGRGYMLSLLEAGADYRIADDRGRDLILKLAWRTTPQAEALSRSYSDYEAAELKPVFDWLSREGVNWEAARAAMNDPETKNNLKNLPADYEHRPWLPQRPTLDRQK